MKSNIPDPSEPTLTIVETKANSYASFVEGGESAAVQRAARMAFSAGWSCLLNRLEAAAERSPEEARREIAALRKDNTQHFEKMLETVFGNPGK